MADEKNEFPEICFHAIFQDYNDAFIYAWDNWLNIYVHEDEDGNEYYEVC